ncbi:MAG: tetratricopeptide repeat protein [Lachnospiraceae bacterium]|nr:tetratricopeptide repeat protein [Lachnospiraceae bacterium]
MRSRRIKGTMAVLTALLLLGGCQGSEEPYLKKAEQYMEKAEYGLALDDYNKAIMEDEDLQEAYRGAGIANLKMADYQAAEDMFLRALKESDGMIGKTEEDLSYYLGEVQICLGKYKEAASCYSNIIEFDEEELWAYFYRGSAYLQMDEQEKAKKDFDRAAKEGDSRLLYGIYEAYESKGSDAGTSYLEQIVKKKAETDEELYIQGRAYYKLGEEAKALEILEKCGKKEYQALFYLGAIYEQRGEYDQAVSYYNSYKDKKGLTFGEYRTVAECMMKKGDYAAALELNHYMKESAGNSETKDLMFEEIVIYERSSDFASARTAAQAYVEQYPEDEEGKKEYEFLQTR